MIKYKVSQFFRDIFDMDSNWNLIESLVKIHANYTSRKYILCNWLNTKNYSYSILQCELVICNNVMNTQIHNLLNSLLSVTSLVSSILSLTLVACDRFFGIVFAMKAHIIERKAKPVIIAVWVISVAVASPLLVYRRVHERHWKNHVERWCDDSDWSIDSGDGESHFHKPSRVAYWTFVSVILFFIPIIAMIGAYCGIIKTLWSTKIPGERVYKENLVQNKMKRKVLNRLS